MRRQISRFKLHIEGIDGNYLAEVFYLVHILTHASCLLVDFRKF